MVKNPHSEENLLIELGGEFSVFFGLWHGQYKAVEYDYDRMKKDVAAILAGNAGVLSLYTDGKWQGSTLCPEKVSTDADMEKLLERCWQKQEPKEKLLPPLPPSPSSPASTVFWNGVLRRCNEIEQARKVRRLSGLEFLALNGLRLTKSQHLRQLGLHLGVGGIGDGQHVGVELFHLVTGGEGGHIHLVAHH